MAAQISVANDTFTIDYKQCRTLTEREEFALDLVLVVYIAGEVDQTGERYMVLPEVIVGSLPGIPYQGYDFCAIATELFVLRRQLTEVPAAERSHETAQENEDKTGNATVTGQGNLISICTGQHEIRSEAPHWN